MTDVNKTCACQTLNQDELYQQLSRHDVLKGILANLASTHPHLFSSTTFFLHEHQFEKICSLISAAEAAIHSPLFVRKVFGETPLPLTKGVFTGYDFHLADDGPKIIEINTNAGGGLLNAELAKAQKPCCAEVQVDPEIETKFVNMFLNEYHLATGKRDLKSIAIVDENPEEQYLYPEFLLFKALFESRGIETFILDPDKIKVDEGRASIDGKKIDLIYNRLTDFSFERYPLLKTLTSTVITPAPLHHLLYADKENLVLLTDEEFVTKLGITDEQKMTLLSGIPKTYKVTSSNADFFWERRKGLFFKPSAGHGSKAAYRGDKVTRKVWEEIQAQRYVAQKIIPPSQRLVSVDGVNRELKVDIRAYVYDGVIQHLTSRLYSGQTTNFRTTGGGFAPVAILSQMGL